MPIYLTDQQRDRLDLWQRLEGGTRSYILTSIFDRAWSESWGCWKAADLERMATENEAGRRYLRRADGQKVRIRRASNAR